MKSCTRWAPPILCLLGNKRLHNGARYRSDPPHKTMCAASRKRSNPLVGRRFPCFYFPRHFGTERSAEPAIQPLPVNTTLRAMRRNLWLWIPGSAFRPPAMTTAKTTRRFPRRPRSPPRVARPRQPVRPRQSRTRSRLESSGRRCGCRRPGSGSIVPRRSPA